jgi:hypothetical protein
MINWPELLIGLVLGVLATLVFWLIDRAHARRQRKQDAEDAWRGVAKEIELLIFKLDTRVSDIDAARARYPIDTWRAILGPDSFRLLEQLENAYGTSERFVRLMNETGQTPELLEKLRSAELKRIEAIQTFANFSREAQSRAYENVVTTEERDRTRRAFMRRPIATWKRERHNKEVRKATVTTDMRSVPDSHRP